MSFFSKREKSKLTGDIDLLLLLRLLTRFEIKKREVFVFAQIKWNSKELGLTEKNEHTRTASQSSPRDTMICHPSFSLSLSLAIKKDDEGVIINTSNHSTCCCRCEREHAYARYSLLSWDSVKRICVCAEGSNRKKIIMITIVSLFSTETSLIWLS